MFLADWSGRRVAAYAILWLLGFPVVMTAFAIMGAMASTGSGGFTVGTPIVTVEDAERRHAHAQAHQAALRDSIVREMRTRDSIMAAGGRASDSVRAVAYLPGQSSDVMVGLSYEDEDWGWGPAELLPWLLPPTLLVAAWAWTRRSRPDPD